MWPLWSRAVGVLYKDRFFIGFKANSLIVILNETYKRVAIVL